jgi:6-phosphogluconolactonase
VPTDSPESNFNIANRYLLQPLKINSKQIHRIQGELEPKSAAALATEEFVQIKQNRQTFDLIILGMGEDGHVASLFPQEPEEMINDQSIYRNVVAIKPPPNRITLGYLPIISAKLVWVVISGENKSDAFANSLPPHFKTPLGRILKARKSSHLFYLP